MGHISYVLKYQNNNPYDTLDETNLRNHRKNINFFPKKIYTLNQKYTYKQFQSFFFIFQSKIKFKQTFKNITDIHADQHTSKGHK